MKPLFLLLSLFTILNSAAQTYKVVSLIHPDGPFYPSGLSDLGQVCGTALVDQSNFINHAVRYEPDGSFTMLTLGETGESSTASQTNSAGQVIGTIYNNDFTIHCVVWESRDSFRILEPPDGFGAVLPQDLNNIGDAAGYILVSNTSRAIYWDPNGKIQELPQPQWGAEAIALNDSCQIVGRMYDSLGNSFPVLWQPIMDSSPKQFEIIELGSLGGQFGRANDINNQGMVVGFSEVTDSIFHAFVWKDNQMVDVTASDGNMRSSSNDTLNSELIGIGPHGYGVGTMQTKIGTSTVSLGIKVNLNDRPFDILDGRDLVASGQVIPSTFNCINGENYILSPFSLFIPEIEAQEPVLNRDSAVQRFLQYIPTIVDDTSRVLSFVPQQPLYTGTHLRSPSPNEKDTILNDPTWFCWVTDEDLHFAHDGFFLLLKDEITAKVSSFFTEWFPIIDDIPYLSGYGERIGSPDRIQGGPAPATSENPNTIFESTTETIPNDSICAILVSGKANNNDPSEQGVFNRDLDLIETNLTKEKLGPRLPAENVARIQNATEEQVCHILETLKDRYRKIIFYYAGHGYEEGLGTRGESNLSYGLLADKLKNTNAKDICVILEACHSGAAIEDFDKTFDQSNRNLMLITSSQAQKNSYYRKNEILSGGTESGYSHFTLQYSKCFGDPNADVDGINGTSKKEAFEWLIKQNPDIGVLGKMNDVASPLLLGKTAVKITTTIEKTIVEDYDLELEPPPDPDDPDDDQFFITRRNVVIERTAEDESVLEVLERVIWNIEEDDESNLRQNKVGYTIGFRYDQDILDTLESDERLGIVRRENIEMPWKAHTPIELDTINHFVRALDVTSFGDWAFAIIAKETTSIPEFIDSDFKAVELSNNRPNPFRDLTYFDLNVKVPGIYAIVVSNPKGQHVASLGKQYYSLGEHQLSWDGINAQGNKLKSGIYFYQIQALEPTTPYRLPRPVKKLILIN